MEAWLNIITVPVPCICIAISLCKKVGYHRALVWKKTLQVNQQALKVPLLREEHIPLLQGKYPHYVDAGIDLSDLNKLFGSNQNAASEKNNANNTNDMSHQ